MPARKPTFMDKMANNAIMMEYQNALSDMGTRKADDYHRALVEKTKKKKMIAMRKKEQNMLADNGME